MPVAMALIGVAVLLAAAPLAVALQALRGASHVIYATCFMACAVLLGIACSALLAAADPARTLVLPIGLPWIGAHFRIDALSAFFLLVTNLGGAGASLFAMGYGRHETAPGRVLPFYPAFLASMNLVVLADDAFSFLIAWEFMSLSSWALVMSHHKDAENRRAGYIYIIMASFGTLTLLLAFGLLAGSGGGYAFRDIRSVAAVLPGLTLTLVLIG
ncbi:MAG: hydrogenase 4 subunit B, partial [Hyphomicrobiaceae bacterium]|nr:hydrogenase 4 subunit B [Hyphomicrobiaceae bacterium]